MAARPGEVFSDAQGTERDALVEAYAVADDARFPNDNAGAMVVAMARPMVAPGCMSMPDPVRPLGTTRKQRDLG
jgi:hypothetical protein